MASGSAETVSPFLAAGQTYGSIGNTLAGIPLAARGWGRWWLAMAVALALTGMLVVSLGFLFYDGVAIWGNNIPVTWALDIANYDWWIGIACGGLLVSGMFLLLDVTWRSAINRISETMALLAAMAAAVYPIIHLGRPWFFYWNLPYPNSFALWPQFRSPLFWDAFDILSFLGLAAGLWFVGLLPDLATMRDRAWERARAASGEDDRAALAMLRAQLYGVAALGWRFSAVHWHRWLQAYRTLALLGVLVVIALQTGASVMFAGTLEPGWHTTLLPVSYLVGAVFAGVGTLSLLTVVLRSAFHLEALVTERHLQLLACLLLGLALADIYCEATTTFVALLGSDSFDHAAELRRIAGQTAWSTWMLITAGLLPPLLFVVPRLRRSPAMLAWIGGSTAAGLWGDHYAFIVGTLQHDFLPSAAHGSHITVFEWTTFAGSFGLFLLLLLLFLRLLPVVSMAESRQLATRTGAGRQAKATPGPDHNAPIWGVAGEFATEHEMARAVNMLRERFDLRVDAYCPVPSEITAVALGLAGHSIRTFAVIGFLFGAIGTFAMCTYATLYDYVFDIGGRPDFSWQSFVVPSLSFGCLCAGMAAVGAMLVGNRLPRLNHPAFNIPGILQASTDRFFVAVHTTNGFDPKPIESALKGLPALSVHMVPR